MAEHPATTQVKTELDVVLSSLYRWLGGVALLSGSVNLLALTGPMFMLQVYDRVLTSRSVPTLVALALIAAALYIFQAVLDVARSRLMVRMGSLLDEQLAGRAFRMVLRLPLLVANRGAGNQPLRDLDNLRGFLSGTGPTAFLDLPWMPLYLLLVFLLHPWLGILATVGALILIALTVANERLSLKPAKLGRLRRCPGKACLKPAGAMPRHCGRWAFPAGSRKNGCLPIGGIWQRNSGQTTSPAFWARFRGSSGRCCNPRYWVSEHG